MSGRAFCWLCAALFFTFGVWFYSGSDTRTCLHKRVERMHHGAWVQFIPVGKSSVPIVHPGHWSNDEVCDRWETP